MSNDQISWYKVFPSMEEAEKRVPLNKMVRVSIRSQQICLAHTKEGWFAIEDACPHLGESLSKGTINYKNEVTCPWHSYRFHLGNGRECEGRSRDAKIFEVSTEGNTLKLGIENE